MDGRAAVGAGLVFGDIGGLHELPILDKIPLQLSEAGFENLGAKLHHRDVVGLALRRLEEDLKTEEKQQVLDELQREIRKS